MYGVNHIDVPFRLDQSKWKDIMDKGTDYFKAFPLADDEDFKKLKSTHQRFIMAYTLKDLAGFHLVDCYRFAFGYTKDEYDNNNAGAGSGKLMQKPYVKVCLDKIDWMRVEAMGFSVQRIMEEEAAIGYSDITEFLDDDGLFAGNLKDLPGPIRRTIKSFEIVTKEDDEGNVRKKMKLSLWDKGQSLQRMQKVKGMHTENINVSGGLANVHVDANTDPVEASRIYQEMLKGGNSD